MGGPFIGKLEFQDKLMECEYLADGEKLSADKNRIVFSKYIGSKKQGIFGLKTKREFQILVYEERTNSFFQSKDTYEALAIEKIVNDKITFHIAFHTEMESFKREINFNEQNFNKLDSK